MANAFISYSRKDTDLVRRLYAALEQQGLRGWVDWEGIPPADDWLRKVYAAIENADAFVFVMSADSLTSAVCADEVAHAVKHNKRLIPVVGREVDRVNHPEVEIPASLRRLNWVFFRTTDDFDAAVGKLVAAIRTDLEWVESHTRVLGRAIEWEAARRDDSFLLQKNDLVAAERWLARAPDKDPKPTALQSEFIISSRTAATRRQRRLTAAAVVASVLVGIGAIVATVQYVIAEARREQSLSRQLAAQSAAVIDASPEVGLLLGVYAHNVAATVEASSTLLAALDRVRGVRAFLPEGYLPRTLALSADGALMAVARCIRDGSPRCAASAIEVWRVAGPQRIGTVEVELEAWRLAFSGDAKQLAATMCCTAEGEKERTRSVMFDLAQDPSVTGGVKLVKVAERAAEGADLSRLPNPAEPFTEAAAVAAAGEAIERVRRAAGAPERGFWGTPAAYVPAPRVLATIAGPELDSPVQVELWDAASVPRRLARGVLRSSIVFETAIRADGRLAAAYGCALMASMRICSQGELVILDATGKQPRVGTVRYSDADWIRSLAVMPGAPLVLSGGCGKYDYQSCRYGELRLWQVQFDGEEPSQYEAVRTFGGSVDSIAFSADGKAAGLVSQRGKLSLLRLHGTREGGSGWLASPLAARFATVRADPKRAFRCGKDVVRDPVLTQARAQLQTAAELCAALGAYIPGINQTSIDERTVIAGSASGTRLALGGCARRKPDTSVCEGGRATVWSIADQRLVQVAALDTATKVTTLALAPDGNRLAVASCSDDRVDDCVDGKLDLVDLTREGHPRRTIAERTGLVTAIAFRLGNRTLAYATCARLHDTGAVRDCALGAIRLSGLAESSGPDVTLTGHLGAITGLAFSPDGSLLASGGSDGSVGLWDPAHGEPLGPVVPGHARAVQEIRFASAETFVSSTGRDEIEWHATAARWKSVACGIANRRLTDAEHTRFLGPRETVRDPCAPLAGPRGSALWRWVRGMVDGAWGTDN